jgi:hypothetical protein
MNDKVMPLSQAIRLGATMKPQAFGYFYGDDGRSSCALGAAADAIGADPERLEFARTWQFADVFDQPLCPECGKNADERDGDGDKDIIIHLNDVHQWTRESIADFVELHEPVPEVAMEPSMVEAQ